jgi:hypothetical protein
MRVTLISNILRPSERETHDLPDDTDVAAWASERHQGRVHVEWLGDDEALAIVYPAMDPIFWVKLAIAIAINFAVQKLLAKPNKPTSAQRPDASPTYSLAIAQNSARLGAPVPCIYGSVVMTPDYAAQPVFYYRANEQFGEFLFCLGHGVVDVTEVIIGQTVASAFPPGIVDYRVFHPADHAKLFGRVESVFGVRENTVSSIDVANQELLAPNSNAVPIYPEWYWKQVSYNTGGATGSGIDLTGIPIEGFFAALPSVPRPADGTPASGFQSWTHPESGQVVYDQWTWVAESPYVHGVSVGVIPPIGTGGGTSAPQWMGPFETCKTGRRGTRLELDFVFPGGLYAMINNGEIGGRTVEVKVEAINTTTQVATQWTESFVGTTPTPLRFSREKVLPLARYLVRVHRVTDTDQRVDTQDQVLWTGMKFDLEPVTTPVYGDVTLLAVKMQATNGVSDAGSSRVRVRASRRLPPLGAGTLAQASNPADVAMDIVMASYGGRRPRDDAEFDLAAFTEAKTRWTGHNGFNAVFDQRITVWEALVLSMQTVAATPLPMGSRLSIAHDCVKSSRVQMFSDMNIVPGTLTFQYRFRAVSDPAGIKVAYRDPQNFDPLFYTDLPNSDDVESVELFGCSSAVVAQQYGTLIKNRRKLTRTVTFETEYEALVARHGDRIGVSAGMMDWGTSGRVVAVNGLTLVSDVPLTWVAGQTYYVLLRSPEGVPFQVGPVTQGVDASEIVLPSWPFTPIAYGATEEPTQFVFGTLTKLVTDWIVTEINPSDERVSVTAEEYSTAAYTGAMPHQLTPI